MAGDNGPAVVAKQLHLTYGFANAKTEILKGINLSVDAGSIYALLGSSGCGKTTLLKCIVGLICNTNGYISVFDQTPGTTRSKIPGSKIGYMPQEIALYDDLTIEENLTFHGGLHHIKNLTLKTRISFLLDFLILPNGNRLVSQLSGGEKRRVSFAIALLHQPPLIILDEPTVGLDPILRESVWHHLREVCSNGNVTVIVTTHHNQEATQANKIGIMRNGRILAQDKPEELLNRFQSLTLDVVYRKLCGRDDEQYGVSESKKCKHLLIQFKNIKNIQPECTIEKIPTPKQKQSCEDIFPPQSFTRVKALVRKNFITMKRSKLFIICQLLIPIIQLGSFGVFIGGDLKGIPIAVCNEDNNWGVKYLLQINNELIHQLPVENINDGVDLVENGKAAAAIHIWKNFSNAIIERFTARGKISDKYIQEGSIHIRYDTTNQPIARFVEKVFIESALEFAKSQLGELKKYPQLTYFLLKVGEPIYGSAKPSSQEFMTSGVIITIIFLLTSGLASFSLIIDKKNGLLNRSYVAGATAFEVVCGHMLTQFVTVIILTTIVIIFSILIFDIQVRGSFILVGIISLLSGLCGTAFGFLLSTICNDVATAIIVAVTITFPMFFTCGPLWSVEIGKTFIKTLTPALPLRLCVEALRWIMNRGRNILWEPVWKGFLVITAWFLIFLILSLIIIRLKK